MLELAKRIHSQSKHESGKVYSVHEPEVQWIAKGNAVKKIRVWRQSESGSDQQEQLGSGCLEFHGKSIWWAYLEQATHADTINDRRTNADQKCVC
jgi:hypothetical protein